MLKNIERVLSEGEQLKLDWKISKRYNEKLYQQDKNMIFFMIFDEINIETKDII